MTSEERHKQGLETYEKMTGRLTDLVLKPTDAQRDLVQLMLEHVFGEIYSRPGLSFRDRSLLTIGALTGMGRTSQLRSHFKHALNGGVSSDEIVEMMIHLTIYCGWPAARTGLNMAEEVFAELGKPVTPRGDRDAPRS